VGILKRLFGPTEPPRPLRDVMALAAPLARPAAHLVKSADDGASHFGGAPPLPAGMAWPARDGRPLTFLACLDLSSLHAALATPWLPLAGRLLFFYDAENQPWGFDPKDRGSWSVRLVDGAAAPAPPPAVAELPRQTIAFRAISSYPSWERPEVQALDLSDAEVEILIDGATAVYGHAPHHQVSGFPHPIQGDEMELECQLVSHGLYCGDSSGYLSRDAAGLRDGAAGILYFWIREEDARAGRFDHAWAVLQCH